MSGKFRVALFKTLGGAAELLPERFDVTLGRYLASLYGRRSSGARQNLRENLRHALGPVGSVPSDQFVERFVNRAFASYGQYWAEGAKLPSLSKAVVADRCIFSEGVEHLEDSKARGKGTILAIPHVGRWEWGGSYVEQLGMPMTAVAEELDPPALFRWFKKKREAMGILIEPLNDQASGVLLRTLRAGELIGLLCDRDLQGNGVEVEFFGERVTMPAGPATLALRTGATLLAGAAYAGPGSDHFVVVTPPIEAVRLGRLRDDVTRITQVIAHELEGLIRRAPEQWHVLQPRFTNP